MINDISVDIYDYDNKKYLGKMAFSGNAIICPINSTIVIYGKAYKIIDYIMIDYEPNKLKMIIKQIDLKDYNTYERLKDILL